MTIITKQKCPKCKSLLMSTVAYDAVYLKDFHFTVSFTGCDNCGYVDKSTIKIK